MYLLTFPIVDCTGSSCYEHSRDIINDRQHSVRDRPGIRETEQF